MLSTTLAEHMLRKCSTWENKQGIKHKSLSTAPGKSGERHQTNSNQGHSAKALFNCQRHQKQRKPGRLSQPRPTKGNMRIKNLESWGFLGSPRLRTLCFLLRSWVCSLAGELKSHKAHSETNNNNNKFEGKKTKK